jgi:hypothetical protein
LAAQFLYRPYIAAASMENRNDHLAPEWRSETPSKHPHIPATLRLPGFVHHRAPKPMPFASATAVQTSPACACCRIVGSAIGFRAVGLGARRDGRSRGGRRDLTFVLHRPVELAGLSGHFADCREMCGSKLVTPRLSAATDAVSLAKFTANRRASSRVSRFGRRAVRRSNMSGI